MSDISELYRLVIAVNRQDFHTCFYCGCVVCEYDHAPPLRHAKYYLETREEADFYRVPACKECFDFLKPEKSALLGQRFDLVKKKLAQKYKRAIRIYEMWDHDEVHELDYSLKKSVLAGLSLGEEACQRVKFKGFTFEADGEKHTAHYGESVQLNVFDQVFDNFRDALDHASKTYKIPKGKLRDLLSEHDQNFDKAINSYHSTMARKLFEKNLKGQCKDFAQQHKQNVKFVMTTVELYMQQDENLTLDQALRKLYQERIK